MSEENACLVRARSDSENSSNISTFRAITRTMAYTEGRLSDGDGEPGTATLSASIPVDNINHIDTNDSGDLIDHNETSVLAQFHEDALRQVGYGIPQLRVLLSTGLAVMSSSVELAAVPLVLPSAEVELCIQPHERNWLLWICLLGRAVGAAWWGWSRRRGLMTSLAVHAVFSTIAAFMPTYGTAMMARLCSSIGSGGLIPISFSYLAEMCPRGHRTRTLSVLLFFMGLGVLYASLVGSLLVSTGNEEADAEDKQHFSGWHRYLLLCNIPALAALLSLVWADESPRYLLEIGREVDAMMLYQTMHQSNQSKVCGVSCSLTGHGPTGSEYRLSELQLPGKRPVSNLHVTHTVNMYYRTLVQIFSGSFRKSTLVLIGVMFSAVGIQFYLSTFVPATIQRTRDAEFEASKRTVSNGTFHDQHFNATIENVEYGNSSFVNCTFRDMSLSHVTFRNCSFVNVTFSNVRTTYTYFKGALFINSSIIDSEIEWGSEIDEWSVARGGVLRGVWAGCGRGGLIHRGEYRALAIMCTTLCIHNYTVLLSALCVLLSPSIYLVSGETALYVIEAIYTFLVTLVFFGASVKIVEGYPAGLRCTAHGIAMSAVYIGALLWGGLGASGAGALTAAIIVACLGAVSGALTTAMTPTSTNLL